ncbi:hypothetical protein OUZ56_007349 [Daphnia magna]|uniref:Uncharacterized protein n=1 Tax=Daphnia magna TaxID=35525 RepID=A0ABR0A9P4_9CRUS|nr:hypothetical protein OUZ56_007349 [Daphnia magna]
MALVSLLVPISKQVNKTNCGADEMVYIRCEEVIENSINDFVAKSQVKEVKKRVECVMCSCKGKFSSATVSSIEDEDQIEEREVSEP